MSGQWPKSKGKGKASDAKEAVGAYEATVVGGRRIGKQNKKKKKIKKNVSRKGWWTELSGLVFVYSFP